MALVVAVVVVVAYGELKRKWQCAAGLLECGGGGGGAGVVGCGMAVTAGLVACGGAVVGGGGCSNGVGGDWFVVCGGCG